MSLILFFAGYLCFFLQHSSGRCVTSSISRELSVAKAKIWYLELTNQCTDPISQFRFLDSGIINHVSSTGCVFPLNGKLTPKDGTKLVVFDGQNDCTNQTGQDYIQTAQGSLLHSSGKCIQPQTSFQSIPAIGAKLIYTSTCNETEQKFILGTYS